MKHGDDLYYIRICQNCGAEQPYGMGYYKCSECRKLTISVVSKREFQEKLKRGERI